jgi:transcription elongation factor GreA-like protein
LAKRLELDRLRNIRRYLRRQNRVARARLEIVQNLREKYIYHDSNV